MTNHQRKRISYAQNFLIRTSLARRIVERAAIQPRDLVIEIGPGRGVLTHRLADGCRQVIAIEKDPTLARRLSREVGALGNVAIFESDFLDLPLPVTPYKVVANIPFNMTAAIVNKLTRAPNPPEETALVIQREAAERFLGEPKQTLAALLLGPWFDLRIADRFRQQDFVPPPRVDVVLLRFSKRGPPLICPTEEQTYRDFVTFGFTAWKPTVAEALGTILPRGPVDRIEGDCGVNLRLKPSEISFDGWLSLFRAFVSQATVEQRQVITGAEERLCREQERIDKRSRPRQR
ncbi:MAG: 23S ribosomal RNA methyltransferase Erm [Nitrolancea sp.]